MDVIEAFLDSWDRQCRIVLAVASRIDESNKNFKPSEDGWPIYQHLAHMHGTRRYFLGQLDEEAQKALPSTFAGSWDKTIDDLDAIKKALELSSAAVREAVEKRIQAGNEKAGFYDNSMLYIQHLIWHEGWHVGLIFLALRVNGQEPPEEWEEANVWSEWRTEVWEE